MAHRRDELDQLHAGGRLIAGPERIGYPEPISLALEICADGDIRFDIHHHEVLAMLHCFQADLGPNRGNTGRINDHIDQVVLENQIGVAGYSDFARLHRGADR